MPILRVLNYLGIDVTDDAVLGCSVQKRLWLVVFQKDFSSGVWFQGLERYTEKNQHVRRRLTDNGVEKTFGAIEPLQIGDISIAAS